MFVSDIRQEFSICRLQFSKKAKKSGVDNLCSPKQQHTVNKYKRDMFNYEIATE